MVVVVGVRQRGSRNGRKEERERERQNQPRRTLSSIRILTAGVEIVDCFSVIQFFVNRLDSFKTFVQVCIPHHPQSENDEDNVFLSSALRRCLGERRGWERFAAAELI